jgi:hypothetical protein
MNNVHIPVYASKKQREKLTKWRAIENQHYASAMAIHQEREDGRRKNRKSFMDFAASLVAPPVTTSKSRK